MTTGHITNPALLPKIRSRKLLDATHEMPCTARVASFIPGKTCHGSTVPAHLDRTHGKGMGTKVSDINVAAACFACHAIIDGVDLKGREYIRKNCEAAYQAQIVKAFAETLARLVADGLVVVPGAEIVK